MLIKFKREEIVFTDKKLQELLRTKTSIMQTF